MEELIQILEGIRPDINFKENENLVDGGLLDSFDVVSIVSELNDHFGIAIRITELKPDNFNSASAIFEMCKSLQSVK